MNELLNVNFVSPKDIVLSSVGFVWLFLQSQPPEVLPQDLQLYQKRLRHNCFPVNLAKFFRVPFLSEQLRVVSRQFHPRKISPPRLGLMFGLGLGFILVLGESGAVFLENNCPRTLLCYCFCFFFDQLRRNFSHLFLLLLPFLIC